MRPALFFLFAFVACNGAPPKTVSFRMVGTPPDARVTIDDIPMGSLSLIAAHGVALPPGQHRITVEKSGFFPSDRLVEAKEGSGPIKVEVALVPIPE